MRISLKHAATYLIISVVLFCPPPSLAQEPALDLDWQVSIERHGACFLCRSYRLQIASNGVAVYSDPTIEHLELTLSQDATWRIFWKLNDAGFFHLDDTYHTDRFTSHPAMTKITAEVLDRTKTISHVGNLCPEGRNAPPQALCDFEEHVDSIASSARSSERSNKR
jgi:hypothetical protein